MIVNKIQSKVSIFYIVHLLFIYICPSFLICSQSLAQESYKLNEIELNRSINLEDEDNLDLPNNPFEIVDRIRRANSMNNATEPSDAIDEAIKYFDMIKEEKQI